MILAKMIATEDQAGIRDCLNKVLASASFAQSKRRADLLRYLAEQSLAGKGESITEYGIAIDVFGKPASFDPQKESTIRAEMSRLRRSLAEYYDADGASDAWRFEAAARGYAIAVESNRPAAKPTPRRVPWWTSTIPAALVLGWGVWSAMKEMPAPAVRAVVVLPFANLTGDAARDYLADGVTENLTDALAHVPGLRVVARTSAFQFKGKAGDVREIGKKVDADTVVEGSIQKMDDRLRVTVQVNRAADGYHILSRHFDGTAAELPRMEHEVALQLLASVRPGVTPAQGRTPSPEAYDLLLQARAYSGYGTKDAFNKIVTLVNEAIARDPEYADAWAALASVYAGGATGPGAGPDAASKVKAAAARAIELDPSNARAYAAEGYADAMLQLDWNRGEDELRNAAKLMPESSTIHQWLGLVLMSRAKFAEALTELRLSENLDPLSPAVAASVGVAYFMARDYDRALEKLNSVARLHPNMAVVHLLLGETWLAKGDYGKAEAEYLAAQTALPNESKTGLALVRALTGKTAEAKRMAAELENDKQDPLSIAVIWADAGEMDKAFAALERAWDQHLLWTLKVHPLLDPVRRDARYNGLLKRAGLR